MYAGYNSDGARVGRTYLKFNLAPAATAVTVYPGSGLYIFSTRLVKTSNANFLCKRSDSNADWVASGLIWANAPNPIGTAGAIKNVAYDTAVPVSAWYKLDAKAPVEEYLNAGGTGFLTLVLMTQNETPGANWGYFARKEFTYNGNTGYGARLLIGVQ